MHTYYASLIILLWHFNVLVVRRAPSTNKMKLTHHQITGEYFLLFLSISTVYVMIKSFEIVFYQVQYFTNGH